MCGARSRETKDRVVQEYLRRAQAVWSSPLSAGAKVRAHNSWTVSVLRYHMALLDWGRRDLELVDRQTRAVMVSCMAHGPKSSCNCLYLPRKEDSRGLTSVEMMWEKEVVSAATYLKDNDDRQVREAVAGMRALEESMIETPISKGRSVLADYGIPDDVLKWAGRDEEAPGASAC